MGTQQRNNLKRSFFHRNINNKQSPRNSISNSTTEPPSPRSSINHPLHYTIAESTTSHHHQPSINYSMKRAFRHTPTPQTTQHAHRVETASGLPPANEKTKTLNSSAVVRAARKGGRGEKVTRESW